MAGQITSYSCSTWVANLLLDASMVLSDMAVLLSTALVPQRPDACLHTLCPHAGSV